MVNICHLMHKIYKKDVIYLKKVLPGLYKGKVKANTKNQRQAVLGAIQENVKNVVLEDEPNDKNINRKIKDIFSSPNYVYKADVSITLDSGQTIKKTIIGRTNNSLITIDDELIDVRHITQIDFI